MKRWQVSGIGAALAGVLVLAVMMTQVEIDPAATLVDELRDQVNQLRDGEARLQVMDKAQAI